MHSGETRDFSLLFPDRARTGIKKNLDSVLVFWYLRPMVKHVVKVAKGGRNFRINIPRSIIQLKRWGDVRFVLVEDHHQDKIIIRRLIDGKALKGDDSPG